jgi:hypothetical protein
VAANQREFEAFYRSAVRTLRVWEHSGPHRPSNLNARLSAFRGELLEGHRFDRALRKARGQRRFKWVDLALWIDRRNAASSRGERSEH